jgi:hypothetical protein
MVEISSLFQHLCDQTDDITNALSYALTCAIVEMHAIGHIHPLWNLTSEIAKYLSNGKAKYRAQFFSFADMNLCIKAVERAILEFPVDLNAIFRGYHAYEEMKKAAFLENPELQKLHFIP